MCPSSRVSECEGWSTEYVRDSCRASNCAEAVAVLGVIHGGIGAQSAYFSRLVAKATELHEAIGALSDSPVELILKGEMC